MSEIEADSVVYDSSFRVCHSFNLLCHVSLATYNLFCVNIPRTRKQYTTALMAAGAVFAETLDNLKMAVCYFSLYG